MKGKYARAICTTLSLICFLSVAAPVSATTISDLQKDVKQNQSQLNSVNKKISGYEDEQDAVEEEISDLDAEMVALLTDINLIEEAIEDKKADIAQTQQDYDAAVAVQEEQYDSMKIRIRFMYERGDASYLEMFFGSSGMGDMMNKANYVEELYEYDRGLLEEYKATVQQVEELQDTLEEEKSELETSKTELEEEQSYVEEVLAQKKEEYENYSVMLSKAKQEAAAYTAKIKQETAQIKKLEEEERKRKEEEERKRKEEEERLRQEALLASQDGGEDSEGASDGYEEKTETPKPSSSGSGKGQQIADFACKYIGYPYRAGGTSLTEGADCSGFVMSVFKKFGVSLPHYSVSQSQMGSKISLSQAKPGDLVFYAKNGTVNHVAIYIGNGQVIHASSPRTGIKISNATYRTPYCVRRILS